MIAAGLARFVPQMSSLRKAEWVPEAVLLSWERPCATCRTPKFESCASQAMQGTDGIRVVSLARLAAAVLVFNCRSAFQRHMHTVCWVTIVQMLLAEGTNC
eukprot:GHRQ01024436.1.p2 GENE.GHRQ01024436.1~~GHRQ01024436.1.p2  ORF type:complete len:101 (-),score=14.33 GHRQ01024436.1:428-730(-)